MADSDLSGMPTLPLSGLTILLAGQFKGYTHTTINSLLSNAGATMTNSTLAPSLTHVIAPSLTGPTNSKLQAILSRRALGEDIHLLPLQWALDSLAALTPLPLTTYELQLPPPTEVTPSSAPSRPSRAAAKAKRRRSSSPPPELAAMAEREDQLFSQSQAQAQGESKPRTNATTGQQSGMVQMRQPEGGVAVDHLFPHKDTCHVLHPSGEVPYDAMLTLSSLQSNMNKYFIIQILQSNLHPLLYYLYFRWGRIGEKGRQTVIDLHGEGGRDDAKRGFGRKVSPKASLGEWRKRGSAGDQGGDRG